ncbi:hypothetical protein D3C71_79830 [compost metagenome]
MKITTISTTRISLNFLINQFYKLGITDNRRLGPLADGVHRIAQALVTSRYSFQGLAGRVVLRLPLRAAPTDGEKAYVRHIDRQINAHITDHFKDGWQAVWVDVKKTAPDDRRQTPEWYVEFRAQVDRS